MLKDASTVIMAEAAALALAASIATKMEYTQVSFLTDSSQLVAFLSAADHHTNPPDWRMKTYTQMFNNCAPSIHPQLYKISHNDNSMADSLAKDALFSGSYCSLAMFSQLLPWSSPLSVPLATGTVFCNCTLYLYSHSSLLLK
jgi:hypothetical protein